MLVVSYGPRGSERAGAIIEDRVVDLADLAVADGRPLPEPTVMAWLRRHPSRDWPTASALSGAPGIPLADVRLGAPVPRPANVFVVGANTHSHVAEAAEFTLGSPPRSPMILAKASSAVTGPTDPIIRPSVTRKLDYEVELGVIIGRRTRSVSRADALDAVAGYVVVNDVSARDVQLAEGEANTFYRAHYLGKSFDGFCPTGPWMVTADEFGDPAGHALRTWVNGELRQDGSTDDLCFDVPTLVSHLSSILTLEPGDLICSGSPAGVAAFRPPGAFLEPGDVVTCEVDGIGRIENPIVAEVLTGSNVGLVPA